MVKNQIPEWVGAIQKRFAWSMGFAMTTTMIVVAIILLGIGLAAGFPVILGYIGDKFAAWSGTAFSITLSIALFGNILINYITGYVTNSNGISVYPYILAVSGVFTTIFIFIALRKEE